MKCRNCGRETGHIFLDLQNAPPSNAFLDKEQLNQPETCFPLKVFVCPDCFLVQIDQCAISKDIFNAGYVYFSSYSKTFVRHAAEYVEHITRLLSLKSSSMVYEAASNDGYLLQFFKQKNIPCLGIEPSGSVALAALAKGVPSIVEFFGVELAKRLVQEQGHADLFIGNNVLAHVPDLNDFIAGIRTILKPDGTATLEFPHLLNLMKQKEFDTVYHEHYSYFSILTLQIAFARHHLSIFRVDELPVHGGSLRIYLAPVEAKRPVEPSVGDVLAAEKSFGLDQLETYREFQTQTDEICRNFLRFLLEKKQSGAKIIGYGAAAKGNTLLNYCGVKPYLIDFIVDITPAKQGKFLPGSHLEVFDEEKICEYKPDYIIIFPWNWQTEIQERLSYVKEWNAKFVTVIPTLEIR